MLKGVLGFRGPGLRVRGLLGLRLFQAPRSEPLELRYGCG